MQALLGCEITMFVAQFYYSITVAFAPFILGPLFYSSAYDMYQTGTRNT